MSLLPLLLLFLPYTFAFLTCPEQPCPCFHTDNRLEVRQLTAEQRGRVSAAFRNARNLVPKSAWSQPGKTMCLLVNSLDASLRPARFPYWDSRVEERLASPKDSYIFLGRFFPDKSMRRKRRRTRDRRARSDLSLPASMSLRLYSALQTGRHAQLLSFMHSVGLQMRRFVNDTCEEFCPENSEFLTCSSSQCWSKLRAGAICSENSLPSCYRSLCINSICSIPSTRKDPVVMDDGLAIVRLPDTAVEEGSGALPEEEKDYYELQTTAEPVSTARIFTVENKQGLLDFNASLPFPTVYIAISIAKRRHIRRHTDNLHEFSVWTEGANLPSGYTQQISGLVTNSSRAYVRVLDPALAPFAVDASVVVELDGKLCEANCLTAKDIYKICPAKFRLSRFAKVSDPVAWFKSPEEIPTKWTGSGYYRRPTQDYMLFKCI